MQTSSVGEQVQFLARSLPAAFVPDVSKQHDVSYAIVFPASASGALVSARASSSLDEIIQKLFEYFNDDLPKLALIPPTASEQLDLQNKSSEIQVWIFFF